MNLKTQTGLTGATGLGKKNPENHVNPVSNSEPRFVVECHGKYLTAESRWTWTFAEAEQFSNASHARMILGRRAGKVVRV